MAFPLTKFNEHCRNRWVDRVSGLPFGLPFYRFPLNDFWLFQIVRIRALANIRFVRSRSREAIPIHFGFIDNGEIDAFADVDDDNVGWVVMYRGTPLVLLDTFYRLLAHPMVLPAFLGPHRECVSYQHGEGIISNIDDLRETRQLNKDRRCTALPPSSAARALFAEFLMFIATEFLLGHEVGHIGRGHCRLIRDKYGISFIREAHGSIRTTGPDDLTLQAIEWDADFMGGACTSLHYFLYRAKYALPMPPRWMPFLSSPERILFAWFFAIATMYQLFGLS